jgi:SNF2 family DNA or RNA helicase
MKIKVENDNFVITCIGLEYIKLKAVLFKYIGDKFFSIKNTIFVPIQYAAIIRDILPREISSLPIIASSIENYSKHADGVIAVQNILSDNDLLSSCIPFNWQNILEPAQSLAVSAMVVPGLFGLCLFDEQGSGKTVMTIAAFDILKAEGIVDAMIIVCPKSVVSEWSKDIERFLPSKYIIEVPTGDRQTKYQSILKKFDIVVTNFESITSMQSTIIAASQTLKFMLVIDESFYVKNASTKRSSITSVIRNNCSKCYLLCGSPAPNSPYDIINQFNLVDFGYTFSSFTKSNDERVDKELITQLIESRGAFIRRLKTEILASVPAKKFHIIKVELKGRQLLLYEKARNELLLELKRLDNSTFKKHLASYFQKRSALLKICTTPRTVDPTFIDVPAKYEYLDKLVNDLITSHRKVIIWSYYRYSIEEMCIRYTNYNPLRIDGTTVQSVRSKSVNIFQNDPSRMILIANPAAAGAGITLHSSHDAIYVSFSNQAAHYLQSLDRIHRRGQVSRTVNYYIILCENTIEESDLKRLRKKELQQHSILGDNISWPTSLDDALNELSQHG